ncbi:MAG: SRPBCC family protein [Myxococcota bacterium]
MGLSFTIVGIYAWGRSFPEDEVVRSEAQFDLPPDALWEVLGDPSRRAEWRPSVDRVGRIDDDAQGRAVWRELDDDEDRFDFRVEVADPGRRIGIAIAAPDQIGIEGGWDYEIEPNGSGSRLVVTESRRIENPLWRGLYHLTRGSHTTVDQELDMLATFLETEIRIEHR